MSDKVEIEAGKYLDQQRRAVFAALARIEKWMDEGMADGVLIYTISVQPPAHTGADWRAIIKGKDEAGHRFVAFANGADIMSLHQAINQVGSERGFKWREDTPLPGARP